jgi:hypothetical protein
VYQTVNGPRSVAQMEAELRAAGWPGPVPGTEGAGAVANAYQRTTGGPVTEMAGQNYGMAAQYQPVVPQTALGGDYSALANAFNQAGNMTAAELAERKRQFDAQLALQRDQMERMGIPDLVIRQQEQAMRQQEFEFQKGITQRQQALAEEIQRGQLDLSRQVQLGNLGLGQQNLALNAIRQAAELGGPENYVQATNFARGVSQTDIPVFLRNLLSGQATSGVVGGAGLSNPQSFGGIATQLTGGQGAAGDVNQQLNLGRRLFGQGGGALAPGALEGLTPTELQMTGSLAKAVGGDLPTFMAQYARSRVGQTAAQAA